MSSPYSILDKRPIDQWKVTELKDELKKRKLMTKGLKEDLIKRLDEALQNEVEIAKEYLNEGFICEPQPVGDTMDEGRSPNVLETAIDLGDSVDDKYENAGDDMIKVDIKDLLSIGNVEPEEVLGGSESSRTAEEVLIQETTEETIITASKVVICPLKIGVQDIQNNDTQNENLIKQLEDDEYKDPGESVDSKLTHVDSMSDSCFPSIQVSEISPVLGFQLTSDSISTDSMSINEKNEIKENIITDNVNLELEVVKEEILETSLGNAAPDDGESHPKSDEDPNEMLSGEEKEDTNVLNSDISNGRDIVDVVHSKKLSSDKRSCDYSMEDDVVEDKHIPWKNMTTDIPVVKEEVLVSVACDDLFPETKDVHPGKKTSVAPGEKRKPPDEEAGENSEPSKRQRRWNTQSVKVPEPQSSHIILSATPKATIRSDSFKPNFSRSDSSISETAPKERVVPPSVRTPTTSLRIDGFVRPFTLKAVEELLSKTGSVISFWMDHIKTHCYITYSSVQEALETRNAVYNLQWPTNGGLFLVAEFVDPQEVKVRAEPPQFQPSHCPPVLRQLLSTPHSLSKPHPVRDRLTLPAPSSLPPLPFLSNQHPVRERLTHPPPPSLLPTHSLSNTYPVRDRLTLPPLSNPLPVSDRPALRPSSLAPPLPSPSNPLPVRDRPALPPPPYLSPPLVSYRHPVKETPPPPSPLPENLVPMVLTLDDLFRKTKASPRIYYLPLSEGQVAAKVASQSHSHST